MALAVALERFETVAGQVQIEQRHGRVELVELHFRFALESGEGFDPVSFGELAGSLVSEADDHLR